MIKQIFLLIKIIIKALNKNSTLSKKDNREIQKIYNEVDKIKNIKVKEYDDFNKRMDETYKRLGLDK